MERFCLHRGLLLLLAWPDGASCNTCVASLHSSFVVNLNFEKDASPAELADGQASPPLRGNESRVVAFAGGQQKFQCKLPPLRNMTSGAFGGTSNDHSKLEKHFRSAKLAPWKGRCFTFRRGFWAYDLCIGRKITQLNEQHGMKNSLGVNSPEHERLHADGSVTQMYLQGTENRTTIVKYVCGPATPNLAALSFTETEPLLYTVVVPAPQFCAWREQNGSQTTLEDGTVLSVGSMLEDLRGRCINTTHGWWTYEYCFPHTLRQYHLQGSKKDPVHTLGTLNGTAEPAEPNKVNVSLGRLKSSVAVPRERLGVPVHQRGLAQFLGNGAVCDETGRARQVVMYFQCPQDWQQSRVPKFVSIGEASLCEYEVLVHTHLVCGHQRMLPARPRDPDIIQCSAQEPGS